MSEITREEQIRHHCRRDHIALWWRRFCLFFAIVWRKWDSRISIVTAWGVACSIHGRDEPYQRAAIRAWRAKHNIHDDSLPMSAVFGGFTYWTPTRREEPAE